MKRLVVSMIVCLTAVARAGSTDELACRRVRHEGLVDGPVVIGLYAADIGTGRSACLHGELSLAEKLGATIDLPGFYGGVRADTVLSGSYRLRKNLAVFGSIEMVHFEFVQNGPFKATAIGLGQLSMGLQGLALETRRFALSGYGRVIVPSDSSTVSVQTTGVELGVAGLFRPRRDLEVHGQLAADFSVGLSSAPPGWRGGTSLSVGVQYAPASWFALAVDLQATLGHRAALDALLPLVALRFRAWRGLGIELAATGPVAGADRRLAFGVLRIGYRF